MKRILALSICVIFVFSLFACGETSVVTDSLPSSSEQEASVSDSSGQSADTDTDVGASTNSQTSQIAPDVIPNLIIANDQIKLRVVVYDLDQYQEGDVLEDLEVWSYPTPDGITAGVKYREDTVFGDVVLTAGGHNAIVEYPSGKEIWTTNQSGNNTHSVEILPSGNVVYANSTGGTLRLFSTCELLAGNTGKANRYKEYELLGAHGVLWDPEYNVLWALGDEELAAYSVVGSGTDEKLVKVSGMGTRALHGGHDLTPDYLNSRYLYFTTEKIYRFDKETNEVLPSFPYASAFTVPNVKGFCHSPNDKFICTGVLGGEGKFFEGDWKESWLTDTLIFYYKQEKRGKVSMVSRELVSLESAFYKVRTFCGRYQ